MEQRHLLKGKAVECNLYSGEQLPLRHYGPWWVLEENNIKKCIKIEAVSLNICLHSISSRELPVLDLKKKRIKVHILLTVDVWNNTKGCVEPDHRRLVATTLKEAKTIECLGGIFFFFLVLSLVPHFFIIEGHRKLWIFWGIEGHSRLAGSSVCGRLPYSTTREFYRPLTKTLHSVTFILYPGMYPDAHTDWHVRF